MFELNERVTVEKKQGVWDLSENDFSLFARFIEEHSGLVFEDYKKDSLRISLTTRVSLTRLQSYEDYYRLLTDPLQGPEEFRKLLSLITINETSFFRNPEQYAVLKKYILPAIIARKTRLNAGDKTLRIWSAGCSTGEEPYSLAIVILESGLLEMGWDVKIMATDVSEQALESARKGSYKRRSLLNMTQGQIGCFFTQNEERFVINDEVRKLVHFDYFNLIRIPFPLHQVRGMDIIFCKNVTIYFKMESTKRVISNFYEALADCGYLFVGHAETLWGISDRYQTVEKEGAFFYMKGTEQGGCLLPRTPHPVTDPRVKKPERRKLSDEHSSIRLPGEKTGEYPWQRKTPSPSHSSAEKHITSPAQKSGTRAEEDPFARCESLCRAGRHGEALKSLDQLVRDDPQHVKARMLTAYISVDREDYSRAKTECLEVIDIDPEHAGAYLLLGMIYGTYEQYDKALTTLKKAVYNNPQLVEAYLQMALIHKELKQWDKAILAYENAARCLKGRVNSVVEGPGQRLCHRLMLDLCEGNIELLKTKTRNFK